MSYQVLNKHDLPRDNGTYELEGYLHGNTHVCLILIDMPPGDGPRLHSHPYEEVFVIVEGQATFTVGTDIIEARAGQIVIVPPGSPHRFVNSGESRLQQIDIHVSERFITTWLED